MQIRDFFHNCTEEEEWLLHFQKCVKLALHLCCKIKIKLQKRWKLRQFLWWKSHSLLCMPWRTWVARGDTAAVYWKKSRLLRFLLIHFIFKWSKRMWLVPPKVALTIWPKSSSQLTMGPNPFWSRIWILPIKPPKIP